MIASSALQDLAPDSAGGTPWSWVLIAVAILGQLLAVLFVVRVLIRGGSPASTLLWVVVILAVPWGGLILYYLFPRTIQLRRLRKRQNRLAWIEGSLDRLRPGEIADHQRPEAPLRLLCGLDPDGVHDGNAVTFLPTGPGFFAAMERAIAEAKDFVHLLVYIFRPDEAGLRVLEQLRAAAARGVEVRLLYDSLGSFSLKAGHLAALRASGGKAEAYLPLLWKRRPFTLNLRNHRKLLVVDGRIAFVGGRNIGDEYAADRMPDGHAWQDAMAKIEGPAVGRLHRVFVEDWYNAAEEDLADARFFPEVPSRGKDAVGILLSGPDLSVNGMWWVGFDLIVSARESVDISSPYLVPPPVLLFALKVVAARGVRVRIHTNGPAAEQFILYHAQRSYYREFLEAGIEIHETQRDYNHAKFMVVDGRTLLIGSANLDLRSAYLNFELGVIVPDTEAAGDALRVLSERCQGCRRITEEDMPKAAVRRLFDGVFRLLSPVL